MVIAYDTWIHECISGLVTVHLFQVTSAKIFK